jgi:tripartite-type tricarboxylate transporter receptor subunit TctC
MKLPHRRQFLHLAAGTAALPSVSRIARAQSYPTRPVRVVVGFAAGGPTDIVARLMGQWLSERSGQQFVIENRPGAGSNIATEVVVRAPPDGYTLLIFDASPAINATLYDKLSFNFIHDIAPVASIVRLPFVILLNPSIPAKTIVDLIAYAKSNPSKVNMASAGIGSPPHVSGELFKMMTGVNMQHVPYRGAGPATTDLLSGQVQFYITTLARSIEYVRSGKLRALAVTVQIGKKAVFVPGNNGRRNADILICQQFRRYTSYETGKIGPDIEDHDVDLPIFGMLSKDERRILSFSGRTLRLWDVATGKQIRPAMEQYDGDSPIFGVSLSEDESRMVAWSWHTLRLWDNRWPTGNLLRVACSVLPDHDLTEVSDRYRVSIAEPICATGVPLVEPDWSVIARGRRSRGAVALRRQPHQQLGDRAGLPLADAARGLDAALIQGRCYAPVATLRRLPVAPSASCAGAGAGRDNGKPISERQAGRIAGTRGTQALTQLGFDARAVPRRARYFAFRGTRKERRGLHAAISGLIKPYPDRFRPFRSLPCLLGSLVMVLLVAEPQALSSIFCRLCLCLERPSDLCGALRVGPVPTFGSLIHSAEEHADIRRQPFHSALVCCADLISAAYHVPCFAPSRGIAPQWFRASVCGVGWVWSKSTRWGGGRSTPSPI